MALKKQDYFVSYYLKFTLCVWQNSILPLKTRDEMLSSSVLFHIRRQCHLNFSNKAGKETGTSPLPSCQDTLSYT